MGCRDLEVSSLDICRTEPIVYIFTELSRSDSLDALTGTHAADFSVLEGSQEPGKDCVWPRDIIIRHDNESSLDLGNGLANLDALIRNWNMEDTDIGSFQRLSEIEESLIFVRGRD